MKHATNAASMRDSNRRLILNLIRRDPMSRADLADMTHLTRAAITLIVDELISEGLVEEGSAIQSEALGRKRTRLTLCHNARFVFGVNLHRNTCTVGVIDLYGDIIKEVCFSLGNDSPQNTIKKISEHIHILKNQAKISDDLILGIGISAPGPVDHLSGKILTPPNFGGWNNIPICDMLKELTGFPTILEKDANARTLEERFFGSARDCENFMLIQLRAGVGAGVMIYDKLYRGSHGHGTEFGHVSIDPVGPMCSCGNRGCLESYFCSILEGSRFASWSDLVKEADSPDAGALLDRTAKYFSIAIISAANLFDIEKVFIVGSNLSGAAGLLVERINRLTANRILARKGADSDLVFEGSTISSCRTGAIAMLYRVFCDRE